MLLPDKKLTAQIEAMLAFTGWLQLLARPELFRTLNRSPSSAHLVRLLDDHLPFVKERQTSAELRGDTSGAQVVGLMNRMRLLLESWSPPALPTDMVEAARELLVADGSYATFDWDKMPDLSEGMTIDQVLVWSSEDLVP